MILIMSRVAFGRRSIWPWRWPPGRVSAAAGGAVSTAGAVGCLLVISRLLAFAFMVRFGLVLMAGVQIRSFRAGARGATFRSLHGAAWSGVEPFGDGV